MAKSVKYMETPVLDYEQIYQHIRIAFTDYIHRITDCDDNVSQKDFRKWKHYVIEQVERAPVRAYQGQAANSILHWSNIKDLINH